MLSSASRTSYKQKKVFKKENVSRKGDTYSKRISTKDAPESEGHRGGKTNPVSRRLQVGSGQP